MGHDEKCAIPVMDSTVLSDPKSDDEIVVAKVTTGLKTIKDKIYPPTAVNMEPHCKVQARGSNIR